MTDQLRDRIAEALMRWAESNGVPLPPPLRLPETVTRNAYSRADAVLAVVQPLLDQQRAAGMREAAAMLRRYCPNHGPDDAVTASMDCHCEGADEIDRNAKAVSAPTASAEGCGCQTAAHSGHYPSCPTRAAAPSATT